MPIETCASVFRRVVDGGCDRRRTVPGLAASLSSAERWRRGPPRGQSEAGRPRRSVPAAGQARGLRSPASPYRALLAAAGWEYGDLVDLVRRDGLESTLRTLAGQGVYLTCDEYKGRRPVVPGSTSGSRGRGTPLLFDFPFVRDCAAAYRLYLDARGGGAWDKAVWNPPGGVPLPHSPSTSSRRPDADRALDEGDAGLVRVERRTPFATASGKVLHLHVRAPTS